MGDIQSIKNLHNSKGWSKKRIARELGISVKTVRRVLAGESTGDYQLGKKKPQPVTGAIEPIIGELLRTEAERQTGRKQRLSAARIEEILRRDHGYAGSSVSVRRAVARARETVRDPLVRAMVPLRYAPGEDAQVDFLEGDVDYPEGRQRRHFVLVRACYSTKPFVYHASAEDQEAFFDGMIQAFEYFGGIFHHLWFDNLTAAVARVLRGRSRQVQPRFAAFMAHYGFQAEFCGVGKGNEKGGVENGVRYFQGRVLSPIPRVENDEELDVYVRAWLAEQDRRRPAGPDRTIGELWAEEVEHLMPLPARRFDACRSNPRHVSAYSLAQDGLNFYSVPVRLATRNVTLKRYAWRVELHDDKGPVATHKRLFGKGQIAFELAHYLPLLERKVRAFDRAAPVLAVRASWPPSYELLLKLLRSRRGEAEGTREFIQVLRLHEHHATGDVHEAVRKAVLRTEPSLTSVRIELDQLTGAADQKAALPQAAIAHLPVVEVACGEVAAYGELCREAS